MTTNEVAKLREEMVLKIQKVIDAMGELEGFYDRVCTKNDEILKLFETDYPFSLSLDEQIAEVENWKDGIAGHK